MAFRFLGRASYETDLGEPIDLPWSVDNDIIRLDISSPLADSRGWSKVGWLNLLITDGAAKYPLNGYKRLIFGTQLIECNAPIYPFKVQIVPVYYLPKFTVALWLYNP